jgi:hypothetical protein
VHVADWRDATANDLTAPMLRIAFFIILLLTGFLLLTGCENKPVENPSVGQIQQIESPLQNTVEGMAKAKAHATERGRPNNPPIANARSRNPLF